MLKAFNTKENQNNRFVKAPRQGYQHVKNLKQQLYSIRIIHIIIQILNAFNMRIHFKRQNIHYVEHVNTQINHITL